MTKQFAFETLGLTREGGIHTDAMRWRSSLRTATTFGSSAQVASDTRTP
jgi:hypothetical protein